MQAPWGERWFGAGKGVQNMAYLSVGIGLGVGIVINGELYRGSSGLRRGRWGAYRFYPEFWNGPVREPGAPRG